MKNKKEIDADNLLFNLSKFQSKRICAMVKADAYGHGAKPIVSLLKDHVEMFGVSSVEEGIFVRKICDTRILVVTKTADFRACKRHNLEVIVEDENDVNLASKCGLKDFLHLKLNCGMNRYGSKTSLSTKILNDALVDKGIKLRSICAHFSKTDDRFWTKKEHQRFLKLRSKITQDCPICFGGSGMIDYDFDFDILRLGIGLFGYQKSGLLPVMKIKSFINKIFFAKAGEFVGYDHGFLVKKSAYFAVVPVGYADGLRRGLSNKFCVEINSKAYRAVGNICMDCFFVEVDESTKVGDEVTILSDAEVFSKKLGTISYEILTGFSSFRGETITKSSKI